MKFSYSAVLISLLASVTSAQDAILSLPLVPYHEVLQRRSLHVTHPGNTINNIPIRRNLVKDDNSTSQFGDDGELETREVGGLYQGYGTHYVDLWVGTPPQRQTVIVDTGSGVTAFPCSGCKDCGTSYHASPFFIESASSSFDKYSCDSCNGGRCRDKGSNSEHCFLSVSYQEGSMWSAYQAEDLTYVGGLHDEAIKGQKIIGGNINGEDPLEAAEFSFNMMFGCQNKITGLFKTQLADGIAGMCIKDSSLYMQMYNQKVIANRSFALCFVRGDDASKEGTVAGALTMGGADTKLHNTPMIYASGFRTKGIMHGVKIRKIYIMEAGEYGADEADSTNSVQINIAESVLNNGSIIVDSGTTDTYMTRSLSKPFKEAFKKVTGFDYNPKGMKLSEDDVYKLPTIILQLEGAHEKAEILPGHAQPLDKDHPTDVLLAIPPAHYIEYETDKKSYVGRFSLTESRGSVLGANTMRGHDILFDINDNGRIGLAASDCDYRKLIGLDIKVEDKASGQNKGKESSGDDYYEAENSKMAIDTIQDSQSPCENKLWCEKKSAVIGVFGGIATLSLLIVIVRKFVYQDSASGYQQKVTENEHLNDLHLDTEIQMAEIS